MIKSRRALPMGKRIMDKVTTVQAWQSYVALPVRIQAEAGRLRPAAAIRSGVAAHDRDHRLRKETAAPVDVRRGSGAGGIRLQLLSPVGPSDIRSVSFPPRRSAASSIKNWRRGPWKTGTTA